MATMKAYALLRNDGGIEIMRTEVDPTLCIEKWPPERQAELSGAVHEIVAVPADRSFRNAWEYGPTGISVNMTKARDLHRESMRQARAPLLTKLDVNYIRADESGKEIDKRTIVAHKQSLRDVTKDAGIDAAQTPDDLKKVWPSILNG